MTNDQILLVLRDAFERADASDPEQEANPSDVDALLAGLRTLIETQKGAKALEAGALAGYGRKAPRALDTFTAEAGGWRVVNLGESFYGATLDDGAHANFPPGESFLPAEFSGAFPNDRRGKSQSIVTALESGELVLLPPGARDVTEWRDKLTPKAWTRRAQSCVSVGRVDELRECLAHMPRGPVYDNFAKMLEGIEAERTAKAAE
jgi:hypothetical protein